MIALNIILGIAVVATLVSMFAYAIHHEHKAYGAHGTRTPVRFQRHRAARAHRAHETRRPGYQRVSAGRA